MIRIGEKRVLSKNTAFDVIVGMMLGSMITRAINWVLAVVAFQDRQRPTSRAKARVLEIQVREGVQTVRIEVQPAVCQRKGFYR